jgi:hypothetical protein
MKKMKDINTMKDNTMLNYVNREQIISKYPISNTTYDKMVKLIDNNPDDKQLTFKSVRKRYIHKSITDKYFLLNRVPNYNQPDQLEKWLNLIDWDYFCCITPPSNTFDDNVRLIKEINKVVKKTLNIENSIIFYSLELFDDSEFSHIHFIMKFSHNIPLEIIKKTIRNIPLVKEKVINQNRRKNPIDIQPYKRDQFNDTGINYTLKTNIKRGVLK